MGDSRSLPGNAIMGMMIEILIFGVAKDIVGTDKLSIDIPPSSTVRNLKNLLQSTYPMLPESMIAINTKYANDEQVISQTDEIALIPPTNGG